ncbi:MAG TPA: hypothetical protein VE978_23620 [Chitinophagales bacterium]|nr:hypothetical protein [Chitinophagales bacterium]
MDSIFKTKFRVKNILIFSIAIGVYFYLRFFDWPSNLLLGITAPFLVAYIYLAIGESILILINDQIIICYPLRPFFREYRIELKEVSKVEIDIGFMGRVSPKIKFYFINGKRRKMFSHINPSSSDMKQLGNLIGQRGIKIKIWD